MPRKGITAYDLLISCPGDVSEYLDAIKDSVENFNRVFGKINNIEVVTKHWSTDCYPQSGDKPQELLNKQFVRDCDAAIVIFWTRFGTPTDKYESGTEEEIEEMLSVGKQVFMYFLDAPINPADIDMNQYQKVKDFREKYKDRGVYAVIEDKHELQRQLTNHLALYFVPLISGDKGETNVKQNPILEVRDVNALGKTDYYLYKGNFCGSKFITEKKEEIIKKFQELKSKVLPARVVDDPIVSDLIPKNLSNSLKNISMVSGTMKDADISDAWKNTIKNFAEKNEIILDDNFSNVGDLKIQILHFNPLFSDIKPSFKGTEEEKERYRLIEDLYWDIIAYNEYIDYFSYIDKISFARLAISNIGSSYDEDIDVKLIIPKGYIFKHSDLPYPGMSIIKELSELGFVDFLLSIKESETVEKYGYFPVQPSFYRDMVIMNPLNQIDASEVYERDKEEYRKSIEKLFLYRVYENEENDILMFHIEYLKHNTSMAFPSVLMFKDTPTYIEYEISSKHVSKVLKGKLEFKQE